MYTLYKIDSNDNRWIIGFYDDIGQAAGAIEDEKAKEDDNARYEVIRDDD